MLAVTYLCSDPDCADEREALVDSLEQLDGLCECGYGFLLLDVAEVELV